MPSEEFVYNKDVMDHFQNPRNSGEIAHPDAHVETRNPHCGDAIALDVKIADGKLIDAKFLTFGCGAAIATCSKATEMIIGKSLEDVIALTGKHIITALGGLPEHKHACAELAPEALKKAIAQYRESHK